MYVQFSLNVDGYFTGSHDVQDTTNKHMLLHHLCFHDDVGQQSCPHANTSSVDKGVAVSATEA